MAVSRCPVCEVSVTLIERSAEPLAIAEHRDRRFDGLGKCPGSGQTIAVVPMREQPLRDRLAALASRRADLEEQLRQVRRDTGAALLEVNDEEGLMLTAAAAILDLSRPTVYRLLQDAEASP